MCALYKDSLFEIELLATHTEQYAIRFLGQFIGIMGWDGRGWYATMEPPWPHHLYCAERWLVLNHLEANYEQRNKPSITTREKGEKG